MFFLLSKFVPFPRTTTKTALYAAMTANVLWELAKHVPRLYLVNVADLPKGYGSFALLPALILWFIIPARSLFRGPRLDGHGATGGKETAVADRI